MSDPIHTTSNVKFSHALTGPYLPTPGKVPGWPFQEMGRWRIDADGAADEWVQGLVEWRREHLIRIGFDDALYRRPELAWSQSNFVHVLTMVEDRYFYDRGSGPATPSTAISTTSRRGLGRSTACCSGTSIRTSGSTIAASSTWSTRCPAASTG